LTGKDEAVNNTLIEKANLLKKNLLAMQIRVKVDLDDTKRQVLNLRNMNYKEFR
jgi:hypothetical protein